MIHSGKIPAEEASEKVGRCTALALERGPLSHKRKVT